MRGDAQGVPVRFAFLSATAKQVCLAGDFNGWSAQSDCLKREGSTWSLTLPLKPGRYEYAFVIDQQSFQPDPGAVMTAENGFGTINSVLIVD